MKIRIKNESWAPLDTIIYYDSAEALVAVMEYAFLEYASACADHYNQGLTVRNAREADYVRRFRESFRNSLEVLAD